MGRASFHRARSASSLLAPPASTVVPLQKSRFCCGFVTAQTSTLRWLCLWVAAAERGSAGTAAELRKRGDGQSANVSTLSVDVLRPSMTSSSTLYPELLASAAQLNQPTQLPVPLKRPVWRWAITCTGSGPPGEPLIPNISPFDSNVKVSLGPEGWSPNRSSFN